MGGRTSAAAGKDFIMHAELKLMALLRDELLLLDEDVSAVAAVGAGIRKRDNM